MPNPLVSIISVNYNEPEETDIFLNSLYSSDYDNFETIIIDNGSTRKVDPIVEQKYPNLTYIDQKDNLGFAGGNNLGIKIAKGKYCLFLNNDTLIPTNFIGKMVNHMEQNPEIGICSPKMVYPNFIIQYAGANRINPLTGRGVTIGLFDKDEGQFDKIYRTDLPHGAAMIVPKKVIDIVGPIPEEYFLYYEELDWCMQIKKAGYQMSYMGKTRIIHKESVSIGSDSPLKVYYMTRNRLLFQKRNNSKIYFICSVLFFVSFAFPKALITNLIFGKVVNARNIWRGALWHLNKAYVFKN